MNTIHTVQEGEGNSEREQLKSEIREALETVMGFTPEIITSFLRNIELLEEHLRANVNPEEELLCRERVQAMIDYIKREREIIACYLVECGTKKMTDSLLLTLAIQKESTANEQMNKEEFRSAMEHKFSALSGITPDYVEKLIRSFDNILHVAKISPSKELVRPILEIDDADLQKEIDVRGVASVFPELVNEFHRYIQRLLTETN